MGFDGIGVSLPCRLQRGAGCSAHLASCVASNTLCNQHLQAAFLASLPTCSSHSNPVWPHHAIRTLTGQHRPRVRACRLCYPKTHVARCVRAGAAGITNRVPRSESRLEACRGVTAGPSKHQPDVCMQYTPMNTPPGPHCQISQPPIAAPNPLCSVAHTSPKLPTS